MKNDHFQKQIKMLCEKNDISEELLSLIKKKHEELIKDDHLYLKSKEYRFLCELFSLEPDISILNYFKNDIKDSEIEPWNSLC